jgi:hypothetical protein
MSKLHLEGCDGSECQGYGCGVCDWCGWDLRNARKLRTVDDRSRLGSLQGYEARVCDLCRTVTTTRPIGDAAFQLRLANAVIDAVRDPAPR